MLERELDSCIAARRTKLILDELQFARNRLLGEQMELLAERKRCVEVDAQETGEFDPTKPQYMDERLAVIEEELGVINMRIGEVEEEARRQMIGIWGGVDVVAMQQQTTAQQQPGTNTAPGVQPADGASLATTTTAPEMVPTIPSITDADRGWENAVNLLKSLDPAEMDFVAIQFMSELVQLRSTNRDLDIRLAEREKMVLELRAALDIMRGAALEAAIDYEKKISEIQDEARKIVEQVRGFALHHAQQQQLEMQQQMQLQMQMKEGEFAALLRQGKVGSGVDGSQQKDRTDGEKDEAREDSSVREAGGQAGIDGKPLPSRQSSETSDVASSEKHMEVSIDDQIPIVIHGDGDAQEATSPPNPSSKEQRSSTSEEHNFSWRHSILLDSLPPPPPRSPDVPVWTRHSRNPAEAAEKVLAEAIRNKDGVNSNGVDPSNASSGDSTTDRGDTSSTRSNDRLHYPTPAPAPGSDMPNNRSSLARTLADMKDDVRKSRELTMKFDALLALFGSDPSPYVTQYQSGMGSGSADGYATDNDVLARRIIRPVSAPIPSNMHRGRFASGNELGEGVKRSPLRHSMFQDNSSAWSE
ncbi:hypothetical protein HK102_009043, partial [Quaeritorhiza haematococci]